MSKIDAEKNPLTLDLPEPELVMWDGAGTAYILGRGYGSQHMSARTAAITKALLHLAIEEFERTGE